MTHSDETVVKPSSLGFHCDGECWTKLGKAQAVIAHLEAISPARRDWFAYGEWATEETLADHALPPLAQVHPIQDFINVQRVEEYLTGAVEKTGAKQFYETHPTLFKLGGIYYIFQGTHRLAALYAGQASTYRGWLLDLDAR